MKRILKIMMILSAIFFMASGHRSPNNINPGFVKYNKKKAGTNRSESNARWTGTLTYELITVFSNEVYNGKNEKKIQVSFKNALPRMFREDQDYDTATTDYQGSGTYQVHGDIIESFTNRRCVSDCQGGGIAELHLVVIREWDNTYDIEAIGPVCHGTSNCSDPYEDGDNMISVENHHLTDKNVLTGTETVTMALPGGVGTATRTTTWNLFREKEDDVELIVTPIDYDNWLPVPGKDELTKGSMMTVNLKLQGINGKPLKVKAESFELTLNNTSIEPGITINYPVEPDPNQLPDLRFLHLPMIESTDPDQFISVGSPDGISGKAFIGSYDGGGWTILTVEATLKDGRHIQGKLLRPGGEIDIRIPKRDPNSHIAEAWLKKYGNPGEMDDLEKSNGNNYKGDGLTSYEEYRGVISLSKFKRLDPIKKEVGIVARLKDFSLFGIGIGWFETASDLKVIRFDYDKDETWWDGRLNRNARTSHDFDQYAIYVAEGSIGGRTLGICYAKALPMIPANITGVIIDWAAIQRAYQKRLNEARPGTPKFTLQEYLAQTVAHEVGHAVNIDHHGDNRTFGNFVVNDISDQNRIFDRNGNLITTRPYSIQGIGNSDGTSESGDMSCMLNYYPYFHWGYTTGINGVNIFHQEPLLPLGRKFCTSKTGTGINATKLFFGDAAIGNCLGQIQLRN